MRLLCLQHDYLPLTLSRFVKRVYDVRVVEGLEGVFEDEEEMVGPMEEGGEMTGDWALELEATGDEE